MILLVWLILVFTIALLYARYIEPKWIFVRKIKIDTHRNINGGRGLRIALLSDFHYPRAASYELVRKAITKSSEFDPDIVLILGDFFARSRFDPVSLPHNVQEVFGNIRSRLGVFGVLGNHDHSFSANAIQDRIASDTQIRLIDNRAVPLEIEGSTIYLVGVGDLWSRNANYEQAVKEVPQESAIVLLSHNPDVIEDISDSRILAQFSGHTHGGQIRLPFFGALRVPSKFGNKYSKGLIKTGTHPLYVNSGICSVKNIRFLCPPEVTWVELF
ncbi:MAG: metallophosphoesterase [Armatimonadota bacterium]